MHIEKDVLQFMTVDKNALHDCRYKYALLFMTVDKYASQFMTKDKNAFAFNSRVDDNDVAFHSTFRLELLA